MLFEAIMRGGQCLESDAKPFLSLTCLEVLLPLLLRFAAKVTVVRPHKTLKIVKALTHLNFRAVHQTSS